MGRRWTLGELGENRRSVAFGGSLSQVSYWFLTFNRSLMCGLREHKTSFIGKCGPEFHISLSLQSGLVNF